MRKFVLLPAICLALLISGCEGKKSIINSIPGMGTMSNYTWMSLYLPWRVETTLPGLGSWHSKPQPLPEVSLSPKMPFIIYIALGSNMYRSYAVVKIDSKGNVTAAYQDNKTLRTLERKFMISQEQVSALRQILSDNRAGRFAASYVDTKTQDGTQGGFTLLTKGSKRRTYMSNAWPGGFRDITEYVCDEILQFDPTKSNYGYVPKTRTIIQNDPEATMAIRGLID